jgi:hypothetical protein
VAALPSPHLWIRFQIDPRVGYAVLAQKVEDAQGVARVARADHPRAREPTRLPQQVPARDERRQDDVAQCRKLVQDLAYPLRRCLVRLTLATRHGGGQRGAAGQMRNVTGESPRPSISLLI